MELRQKFVGTIAWDVFDFITFGVFENKKNKTAVYLEEDEQRRNDPTHQADANSQAPKTEVNKTNNERKRKMSVSPDEVRELKKKVQELEGKKEDKHPKDEGTTVKDVPVERQEEGPNEQPKNASEKVIGEDTARPEEQGEKNQTINENESASNGSTKDSEKVEKSKEAKESGSSDKE